MMVRKHIFIFYYFRFEFLLNIFQPFPKQALVFTCLQYQSFENTAGKGEIARNEQFLPFPTVFFILSENLPPFSSKSKLSSANSFSLGESEICRLGKYKDVNG